MRLHWQFVLLAAFACTRGRESGAVLRVTVNNTAIPADGIGRAVALVSGATLETSAAATVDLVCPQGLTCGVVPSPSPRNVSLAVDTAARGGSAVAGGRTIDPGPEILDPGAVYMLGTLELGRSAEAIAALGAADKPLIGLPAGARGAHLDSSGNVVYVDSRSYLIRKMVRDLLTFDAATGRWDYPADPAKNDPLMTEIGCGPGSMGPGELVVQAGAGAILFYCGGRGYHDLAGTRRIVEGYWLRAWNRNDAKLVLDPFRLAILDPGKTDGARKVQPEIPGELIDARTHGEGFRVAVKSFKATELWEIDATGHASRRAVYAPPPPEVVPCAPRKLDAEGNLYGFGMGSHLLGTNRGVICKFTVHPPTAEVIYREQGLADTDWRKPKLRVYTTTSVLISGP